MKRITVDLPEALYKRLRIEAALADRSVSEMVRRLLDTSLPDKPVLERKEARAS